MAKKANKKFLVLFSSCGEFTQAQASSDCKIHPSLEAAKKAAPAEGTYWEENDSGERPERTWIVEIAAEGFPSGFTWS